jgi:glyoxylase-like metal-dependent hydrolase (beta-lactamase superfamily II)
MSRLEYITGRVLVADTGRDAPEEGVAFYRAAGWDEDALDSYKIRFGGFGKAVSRVPDAYKRISDGDVIEIGGRPWRVITGNGHCPEHVCLWQEELKLFISGDQVLPRISSNVSVFPTEPDGDPLADWISSCKKLLAAAVPNDVLVLPSHNELAGLRTEGVAPALVAWAVAREISVLAQLKHLQARGGNIRALMPQLRIWQSREALVRSALARYSDVQLAALLEDAARVDRVVEGVERAPVWEALTGLVIDLLTPAPARQSA